MTSAADLEPRASQPQHQLSPRSRAAELHPIRPEDIELLDTEPLDITHLVRRMLIADGMGE